MACEKQNIVTSQPCLHTLMETRRSANESARRFWGHELWPKVTRASVNILRMCLRPWSQVADARTPLLKFKIEREILVLESSRLGKNYWSFPIWWLNHWPCFLSHLLRLYFLKCPFGVHVLAIWKYRASKDGDSWRVINPKVTRVFTFGMLQ